MFELLLILWLPFPMFKIYGGYNIGVFRHVPVEVDYALFSVVIFTFANLLIGFINFLYYQISNTKIIGDAKIFSSISKYLIFYLIIWIIFSCAISIPIWVSATSEENFEAFNLQKSPFLRTLFENENFFGFLFSSNYIAIIYLSTIFIIYFIIVILFNIKIVYNILKLRKHVTKKIWHLQRTLYLTFLFQTVFSIIVLFAPILFIFIMAAMDKNDVYMRSTTVIIIMSTQPPVCHIIMIFSIQPYRRFILKLMLCNSKKIYNGVVYT